MKNLLFLFGILCILASCKKNYVEPITSNGTNDSVNIRPTFVYTTRPDEQNKTVYRFAYYPNGLLKNMIQYDSANNIHPKDSTLYTYNASNQVIATTEYSGSELTYKTEITYTNDNNIETVWHYNTANQRSVTYKYVYASATDVAYVLKYDETNTLTDSIAVDDNVITHYFKPAPENARDYTLVNGYATYNPTHYFITPSGAYIDAGLRSPLSPDADEWGYVYNDPSMKPGLLNKNINFQYEVAEKFLNVGMTGFPERNFYITQGPRQYYTGYQTPNASGYGTDYTFDQEDRLIQIVRRYDYYTRSGSPIPGYAITEIRYE